MQFAETHLPSAKSCQSTFYFSMHEEPNIKSNVYKLIELTGTSTTSIEDAISRAIRCVHKTVKDLRWFQVIESRGVPTHQSERMNPTRHRRQPTPDSDRKRQNLTQSMSGDLTIRSSAREEEVQ